MFGSWPQRLVPWVLFALPALAFGPRQALTYRPPELKLLAARAGLAAARADYARLGLSGTAGATVQDELAATLGLRLDLSENARLAAESDRQKAEARLRQTLRDGVYRALKAHAGLWQALAAAKAARARLRAARLRLEAAEKRGGPLARATAKNGLEDAELGLELAELDLKAAAQEAKALGLEGPAEPGTLRFVLPAPRPDPSQALAVRTAKARAGAAERGLFTLRLALAYQGDLGYRLEAESQTPSLALTLGPKNPLAPPGTWKAELSARLALDPVAWNRAKDAELAAREAALAAQKQRSEREARLKTLRSRALLLEKRLALAKKALALAEKRLEAARLRHERGLVSALDLANEAAARYEAEAHLAQAWGAYLDAVKAYLDLANGEWRER